MVYRQYQCHITMLFGIDNIHSGPHFNIMTMFPCKGSPIIRIRQPWDHLIFITEYSILIREHLYIEMASRAPFQYLIPLVVRSREVSRPRYWRLELCDRSEIWRAPRQPCCRGACQISERYDNSNYESRGFETLWYLTIRRLIGYWNGALVSYHCQVIA